LPQRLVASTPEGYNEYDPVTEVQRIQAAVAALTEPECKDRWPHCFAELAAQHLMQLGNIPLAASPESGVSASFLWSRATLCSCGAAPITAADQCILFCFAHCCSAGRQRAAGWAAYLLFNARLLVYCAAMLPVTAHSQGTAAIFLIKNAVTD
jgi:hypothetical protein